MNICFVRFATIKRKKGIPDIQELPPFPTQAPPQNQPQTPRTPTQPSQSSAQPQQQAPPQQPSGGGASFPNVFAQQQQRQSSGTGSNPFEFLRQHPQFSALKQLVQTNPALLPRVLQELAQQNPQLMQLIATHQQEFLQVLQEPSAPSQQPTNVGGNVGGNPPSPGQQPGAQPYIQVTQEEKEAIDRVS